jgi:AP endonuclease 1
MSDSELSSPPSDILEKGTSVTQKPQKKAPSTPRGKKRAAESLIASAEPSKRRRSGPVPRYREEDESVEEEEITVKKTPKRARKASRTKVNADDDESDFVDGVVASAENEREPKLPGSAKKAQKPVIKAKVKKTIKSEVQISEEAVQANGTTTSTKAKRKRKTKEEKEAEMQPLAARTIGSKVLVGAHVSAAGGVQNALINSHHIGGNAFALFLKSQRKWENPALKPEHRAQYLSHCKTHGFTEDVPPIVPHGSYLVNLCHPDPERTNQAYGSFIDDLDRCRQLGIKLYNFHPGNCAANSSRSGAINHLAGQLNRAHADPKSGSVITLLETMAAVGGNTIGSRFEDLRDTIALTTDKIRIGVCLDTCHIFAAGYDIRTPEAWISTMSEFDEIIGLEYLRALHINDSKAPLASGRDLHANIGTGFLGLRAFHNIVNDERMWGLPLILETPIDRKDEKGKSVEDKSIWAREIKLLESLVGMDVESEEFKELETRLKKEGEGERTRIQSQVDKRVEKEKKKKKKKKKKEVGKKKGKKEESASESEPSELEDEEQDFNTQKLGGPSQA